MEWPQAARQNKLALAYQAGHHEVLTELMDELSAIMTWCTRGLRRHSPVLPNTLTPEDLKQQAWLLTVGLVQRWNAEQGDIGGYVKNGLSWALWRWVQYHSSRRGTTVRVSSIPHDIITDQQYDVAESDEGLSTIVVEDMLQILDPLTREVVRQHAVEGLPLTDITRARGWNASKAFKIYHTGLAILRLGEPEAQRELEALLTYMYAQKTSHVPGRVALSTVFGITDLTAHIWMSQLRTAGLITAPQSRRPGRLVHPSLATALEVLHKFA